MHYVTLFLTLTISTIAIYILIEPAYALISEFKITPSDGAIDDQFGSSVSISGEYALVGAIFDDRLPKTLLKEARRNNRLIRNIGNLMGRRVDDRQLSDSGLAVNKRELRILG